MRTLTKNLLVLAVLASLAVYFGQHFARMQEGMDFGSFYAAVQMVRQGQGHLLFDVPLQDRFLTRYGNRTGIYFIHPPFETLIYLPFCLWSLSRAFLLWSLFNMVLLVLVARILARYESPGWSWRIMLPLILIYVPVLLNFMHGQDSILLLFFFVMAFAALEERRKFTAGCVLALGVFKPHLAIPAALPLLISRRKDAVAGFASVSTALLLISAEVSGWGFLISYPRFLIHLSQLPLAGLHKQQMANLRALVGLALNSSPSVALALTLLTSLAVLCLAVHSWFRAAKHADAEKLAFANAVIAAILVSYHLSPHDLSILLLPMSLLVRHLLTRKDIPFRLRTWFIASLALIFLPPLHLLALQVHVYTYLCLPILLLFGVTYLEIRRLSTLSKSVL